MLNIASNVNKLPRESRDALFLVAAIAWICLPLTAHLPPWCTALAGCVLVWRAHLALRNKSLPGRWVLLVLLVLAAGGTYFSHRTLLGRDAGVTLIVVLLSLKTLELRAKRDAFVVFFLGFFTLLTNFFYSQSLLTAAAMLVAVLVLLTALVNAHMTVGQPSLFTAAKTAAKMTLIGAPIMAVLFALFPRLAPLWGIPSDGMSGRSGLSASMAVGNVASLALDESIAFRVEWLDAAGKPGAPAPAAPDLYFRGPVLSVFDGRTWKPEERRLSGIPPLRTHLSQMQPGVRQRITMEPSNKPWLFALESVGPVPPGFAIDSTITPDLQWKARQPIVDLTRYEVVSYPNFQHGLAQGSPVANRPVGVADYLERPSGFNPATLAWTAKLRQQYQLDTQPDAVKVERLLTELRTGGYSYTLEPGTYGTHTADEFWFERKAGFCEHIASAFVIALRDLDVPARIVTGYQGGQFNSVDGIFTVRQSDAHAWAEVWLRGQGWVRVDPTSAVAPARTGSFTRLAAPQTVFGGAVAAVVSPDMAKRLRAAWEAVNTAWNDRILSYTQSKQLNLLKQVGFQSPSWEHLGYLLAGLLMLAGAAGSAWTWWSQHEHDPWLRTLKRTRTALAKCGVASTSSSTPRELAKAAVAKLGTPAQALAEALLELEALRYANGQAAIKLSSINRRLTQASRQLKVA